MKVVGVLLGFICYCLCLHFREDKTFKILQFTDLHFGTADDQTVVAENAVLDYELPIDLVVLTGDQFSGGDFANASMQYTAWYNMVTPMVDRNLLWGFVFGNHDDQGYLTRDEIMSYDQTFPGSISKFGSPDLPGVSNYWHPIYRSDNTSEIVAAIYFLAVGDHGCENDPFGNGCITTEQIAWYQSISTQLSNAAGKPIFSLMFLHIPLTEYVKLWNKETCWGIKGEDTCCPQINTGLYDALAANGDVRVVSVGHDHSNDFCGHFSSFPNLQLCHGRKSGYGAYNSLDHGGRTFLLSLADDGTVTYQTWIRTEYGEIDTQAEHDPRGWGQETCFHS
ncbi:metallophosphoesterase family protein [Pelomyxa schiedti]|nr:metallophosphoesterase family protein [Pelomyxa schiedti]